MYRDIEDMSRVQQIVLEMEDEGLRLRKTKEAVGNQDVFDNLVVLSEYKAIHSWITQTESLHYTMREAVNDLKALEFDEDPCLIKQNIAKRLEKNDITKILSRVKKLSPHRYMRCLKFVSCHNTQFLLYFSSYKL